MQIKTSFGSTVSNQEQINNAFWEFYTKLYTSECETNLNMINSFFEGLNLPQLGEADITELDSPLSIEEVQEAIRSMQSGKVPGPDGYATEFYKTFSSDLAPMLLAMYSEALSKGQLPPTLRQASICLSPKKDKDLLLCESYRPISLLNGDYKVLAKCLAKRLEKVLQHIISPDQTGFVQGRYSFLNTRKLFNIVYTDLHQAFPELVLSLDAEKAFDRVEWGFLFKSLEKFGFGPNFISWVKLLYTAPSACVRTNDVKSKYFPLQRGTRQGCPLSPLFFDLVIEPLTISLRHCHTFEDITWGNTLYKVALYADDLLLFVSNPMSSIPSILSKLDQFGKLSGYKLNLGKSELYPVNSAAQNIPSSAFPFRRVNSHFKYLGIVIPRSFNCLLKFNLTPLIDKCKQDLERWHTLPLSMAGCINLIKMNIIPRF